MLIDVRVSIICVCCSCQGEESVSRETLSHSLTQLTATQQDFYTLLRKAHQLTTQSPATDSDETSDDDYWCHTIIIIIIMHLLMSNNCYHNYSDLNLCRKEWKWKLKSCSIDTCKVIGMHVCSCGCFAVVRGHVTADTCEYSQPLLSTSETPTRYSDCSSTGHTITKRQITPELLIDT